MPVILDLPGMFLAGSTIAMASGTRIRKRAVRGESRYVRSALIFSLFYCLSTAFPSFWREDWMWSYLPRPPLPTMMWYLLFVALLSAFAWAGASVTQRALRRGQRRRAWAWLLGALGVLAAAWAVSMDAYLHIGTLSEYRTGRAFTFDEMPDTRIAVLAGLAVNSAVLVSIGVINRFMDQRDLSGKDPAPS
jgi:hypothetical protein